MEVYRDKNKGSLEVGLGHGSQVGGHLEPALHGAWVLLARDVPNQNDTCPLGKCGAAALTARPVP